MRIFVLRLAPLLGRLALLLLMSAGCAGPERSVTESAASLRFQKIRDRLVEDTRARKGDSLKPWLQQRISGMDAPSHATAHTALLLPGSARVSQHRREEGASVVVTMQISGRGDFYVGSAVPVGRGGYFLTASHCLDEGPATLFALTPERTFRSAAARVVWQGRESRGEPDLALIHAPLASYGTLALADLDEPKEGTEVLLAGWGAGEAPALKNGHGGGEISGVGPVQTHPSGARWRMVYHTAPFAPGDSGGPLMDSRGRLMGINIELSTAVSRLTGRPRRSSYRCAAVLPDRLWIRGLVEKDRRKFPEN